MTRVDVKMFSLPELTMFLEIAHQALKDKPDWIAKELGYSDEVIYALMVMLDEYME